MSAIQNNTTTSTAKNVLLRSISVAAEEEECILSSYNTSRDQRKILRNFLIELSSHQKDDDNSATLDAVPIFWSIEVADEYSGWYEARARQFYVSTRQLLIEVSDLSGKKKIFEGLVPLDPRVVRLVECKDSYSKALFNQIVRDSIRKVKWELDWFDTSIHATSIEKGSKVTKENSSGEWHRSFARYYVPILNAVLVEDYLPLSNFQSTDDEEEDIRGLAMVYIDQNIRLCKYYERSKKSLLSLADFVRLILEEGIKCTHEAREQVATFLRQSLDGSHINQSSSSSREIPPYSSSSTSNALAANTSMHRSKPKKVSTCVICMERPIKTVAFVPCGHMILCEACLSMVPAKYETPVDSSASRHSPQTSISSAASSGNVGVVLGRSCMTECPLCRQEIYSKLVVYTR